MFQIGQRWFSEGEPELGLGIIENIEQKIVSLYFPLANETRSYNAKNSPLKRFSLEVGDELITESDENYIVEEIQEQNNILFYLCKDAVIPEMNINAKLDLGGPQQRIMANNFDSNKFFDLRYLSALQLRKYNEFKYKGFLSGKLRLLPHQLYVVNEVLNMDSPKVMLCDEVGLGKTIEASLILNSFLQKELVKSALILVPESLTNQWFIELFKKFNISCKMFSEIESQDDFQLTHFVIASTKDFKQDESMQFTLSQRKWDCLILDESHQFDFNKKDLPYIQTLEDLNSSAFCSLFLSATPEVMGFENLFAQLHFLDPVKYNSFDKFQSTLKRSQEISSFITQENFHLDQKKLLQYFSTTDLEHFSSSFEIKQALIDRFGTGRNYFRNSRKNLERYSKLFNKRILHTLPISIPGKISDTSVFQAKMMNIYEQLLTLKGEKVLIICHSKNVVLKLADRLQELQNFKLASFHSDQSVLERDRQAAYFANEDGAQILISTEIGSEGRNFEFAHHLILFDLPKLPDQLEQRIGRLDRIGQEENINIHIPYIKNTFEEILFRWYHEVFNSFESSPLGASEYYQNNHNELIKIIESPFSESHLEDFVCTHKKSYQEFKSEIEKGRDILIEENSYNDQIAKNILKDIESFEKDNSPLSYLEAVFDAIGIRHEELNEQSFHVIPMDNMLIPSYPGLSSEEGMSISYNREYSLRFDNIQLMNWEHPIVKNAFELLLNSPLGNSVLVKQDHLARDIYFEMIINLFCSDGHKHQGELYLPLTPLRVLLNIKHEDLTKKYPKKLIDSSLINASEEDTTLLKDIPKDFFQELIKKALIIASQKKNLYVKKAVENCQHHFQIEIDRLNSISMDQDVKTKQLITIRKMMVQTSKSIESSSLTLDSIRIILPTS